MDPKSTKPTSSFQSKDASARQQETSRGSFRKEPPVVPERVAVMKANYKQAWLFFLLGLSLIVAWGGILRFALIRAFAVEDNENIPRTSSTFLAIAYEGISESEKEVTPEVFSEQMETLAEAGYNSITLQDVKAFYEEGRLLPEKAILLTFDHSRKSSYFDARRVLQDYGWRAVMFVWTKPILDEDPAALRWPYIRAMINSGSWEAGAQSHQGFERIPIDSEGSMSNFLTSPRWLSSENRFETPQEFQARLRQDHEFVFNLIKEETDQEPLAFAFPYGDFGQFDERALLTRQLNMDLVDEFYDMGFVLGNAALNTLYSNPLRLNRLLVHPEWSDEELLSRLEASWPQEFGMDTETLFSSEKKWQQDWGRFQIRDETIRLEALDDNTGAKVWINGTDLYRDFSARFVLRIQRGQTGIFLRASKDGESHLYLGLGDDGEVWLRQKTPGMESITLGTSRFKRQPDGTVTVEVYARDSQLFVSSGDKRLFEEIILTRGRNNPGLIGLSVWEPEVGAAATEILDIHVEPFHNRLVTWEPMGGVQKPILAGWMNQNGYKYNMLSAPWLRFGAEGRAEQVGWDPAFFRDLAKVYNMSFIPEIIVDRSESIDASTAENIVRRAQANGADGVYCNLSGMVGGLNIARVTSWLESLSEALLAEGIELAVSLPSNLQGGNTITSLIQGLENLKVVFPDTYSFDGRQHGLNSNDARVVTWHHAGVVDRDLPLYHQLQDEDPGKELLTSEVRSRILWEEGQEAFEQGRFDQAIELWTRWSEAEPYNEKPPRYIGDVYRTQQDYSQAVSYYQKSLELNPGQISLVITTAKLLNQVTPDTQAPMDMLSLYSRLFPDNSEINLAQAELLLNDGQISAAGKRIKEVIQRKPEDLIALSLLHDLLQTGEERVQNLEQILSVGEKMGMYTHFARSLTNFDLLLWPESWRLMNLVNQRAQEDHPDAELYQNLLPRDKTVREVFQFGRLSDQWDSDGFISGEAEEGQPLYLAASPTTTEAALKLKRSSTMQNGFIEAVLDEARGFFWLYARRSEGNMIRFGFEPKGDLHMQIWKDGEIITNMKRGWMRPSGYLRLRLEIRGDAVFGYVDGKPAFGAPIQIPPGMNLGWWGMAPWAPEFGLAQAIVREVAGGPLPVHVGVFEPKTKTWTDEAILAKLKPNTSAFSVLSPAWLRQDTSGELVPTAMGQEFPKTRLFTRYYKIRLYPMVLGASSRNLNISSLIELAKSSNLEGFTLSFARLPSEEWFEKTEAALVGSDIGLLAVDIDEVSGVAKIRELGGAPSLLAGPRNNREFEVVDVSGIEQPDIMLDDSRPFIEAEATEEGGTGGADVITITPQTKIAEPVTNQVYLF